MPFDLKDIENIQSLLAKYFFDFEQALSTKDFSKADESLERLKNFQNFMDQILSLHLLKFL